MKNQKPIELDVHLKYQCPNSKCGYYHWLSLQETKIKNFKVVCECGQIFQPKRISKLKILYHNTTKPIHKTNPVVSTDTLPLDLYRKCSTILLGYGFLESEILRLVTDQYDKTKISDAKTLIKNILQNLEN